MGDRLGELDLLRQEVVWLRVVQHELAEQLVLRHQGDERDGPDAFRPEQRVVRGQRGVAEHVGDDHRLGILRVPRPRRVALDGRPVLGRQSPPGPEAHHAFVVEHEDAGPVGRDARHQRLQRLVVDRLGRVRPAHAVHQRVEDLNDVARLRTGRRVVESSSRPVVQVAPPCAGPQPAHLSGLRSYERADTEHTDSAAGQSQEKMPI